MLRAEFVSDFCILHLPPERIDFPPVDSVMLASRLKQCSFSATVFDFNVFLRRKAAQSSQGFWQPVNEHYWQDKERLARLINDNDALITKLVAKVAALRARFVVVDLHFPGELFAAKIIRFLKQTQPEIRVIALGKAVVTKKQQDAVQELFDGDIDFFQSTGSFLSLPRFLFEKAEQNEIAFTESQLVGLKRHLSVDQETLDNLMPDYDEVRTNPYRGNCYSITIGKGCNRSCGYCSKGIFRQENYLRSVTTILAEIRSLQQRYGAKSFYLSGAPVNADSRAFEDFCDQVLQQKSKISWSAEITAVPCLTVSLLTKMRDAGCHTLHLCAVSGSDSVLSSLHAGFTRQQLKELLDTIDRAGIRAAIRFVTGYPGEYKQEFVETLDFVAENIHAASSAVHPFKVLKIYPGSVLPENYSNGCSEIAERVDVNQWRCSDGNTFYMRKILQNQLHYHLLKFNIPYNPDDLFINPGWTANPISALQEKTYKLNSYFNPWHTYRSDILSKSVINYVWGKTAVVEKNEIDYPVIDGIESMESAFIGPETVHLDITNVCNYNCIACWDRSPLIRDRNDLQHEQYITKSLSYEQVTGFIDDIIELGGVRFLKFSGGGEPTMHPRFGDILTYLRMKDRYLEIDINTNFSRIDDKLLQTIVDQKVDLLTVSLWAASSETYVATHPNQKGETFFKIKDNLKRLKSDPDNRVTRLFLHNVLMRQNYHEVEAMVQFGVEVGADEVHFAMVDAVPGKTESLLLSEEEHKTVQESLARIKPHVDRHNLYRDPNSGKTIQLTNFHEFFVKMSQSDVEQGVYDLSAVNQVPCYIGWMYTRVMADGRVVPCCKGHRLPMGNLNDQRFIEIWNSKRYKIFRKKGLFEEKSSPYFSVMGDDGKGRTGCLNCDNIMHNTVMHDKFLCYSNLSSWFTYKMRQWWQKLF